MKVNKQKKQIVVALASALLLFSTASVATNEIVGDLDIKALPTAEPHGLPDVSAKKSETLSNGKSLEMRKAEIERQAKEKAMQSWKTSQMPFSPEVMNDLQRLYTEQMYELEKSGYEPKAAKHRIININPNAKSERNAIRIAPSRVTTLTVEDTKGNPWTVESVIIGNNTVFRADNLDPELGHIFNLVSLTTSKSLKTNAVLMLKGSHSTRSMRVPISLDIESNLSVYEPSVTLRVRGISPLTAIEQSNKSTLYVESLSSSYVSWNNGVVPDGAVALGVKPSIASAWQQADGKIVVQSQYDVVAPHPIGRSTNAGTRETIFLLPRNSSRLVLAHPITKKRVQVELTGM